MSGSLDIPAVTGAALPRDVREADRATQDRYRAALGFERVLVKQLAESLSRTTGAQESTSAATEHARSLLPGTLADAITQDGGLGLARTIAGLDKP